MRSCGLAAGEVTNRLAGWSRDRIADIDEDAIHVEDDYALPYALQFASRNRRIWSRVPTVTRTQPAIS